MAIGVTLTKAHMMVPEQSTSAIVIHHPECEYFAVRLLVVFAENHLNNFRKYLIKRFQSSGSFFEKYWFHVFLVLASIYFCCLLVKIHNNHFVIDHFVEDFAHYLKELGVTFLAVLSAFSLDSIFEKGRKPLVILTFTFGLLLSLVLYIGSEYWTDCLKDTIVKSNNKVEQLAPDIPQPTPASNTEKSLNDLNAQAIEPKDLK